MSTIVSQWKDSLTRTRKVAFSKISTLIGTNQINEELWEELETILIQADLGLKLSLDIISNLRSSVSKTGMTDPDELIAQLKYELFSSLLPPPQPIIDIPTTQVIMVVGVNGSGKTTTVAKIGHLFQKRNRSVIFAAADTFRAAATEQLRFWGNRLNIPVIAGLEGSDPGAVAFDAISSAKAKNIDYVIIDTAGRLHTRYNLMEELKKVKRVVGKVLSDAPNAIWLVLDATTGQNAFQQALIFKESIGVTGIILAKLDSSAKGGMAFAIQKELGLPILYAGLGEQIDDLHLFDREAFVNGIFTF